MKLSSQLSPPGMYNIWHGDVYNYVVYLLVVFNYCVHILLSFSIFVHPRVRVSVVKLCKQLFLLQM